MRARRILSCLLLPAYLSSCTAWHVQGANPAQVVEQEQPSQIRVTMVDHSEVLLDEPYVSGDTLIGRERDLTSFGSIYDDPKSLAVRRILLSDISHVAIQKTDVGRGMMIGLGIAAVATSVVAVAGVRGMGSK